MGVRWRRLMGRMRFRQQWIQLHLLLGARNDIGVKLLPVITVTGLSVLGLGARAEDLKLGIIGLDTSHVTAFTKILNDPSDPKHVPGGKVVAAFKSSSADIPSSASKVDEYAATLQKDFGVKLVGSIEDLCKEVDAVLIESVDGRPHLEQAKPVIAAKKRLFIDKPIGGTLSDTLEIFRLAKEAGVPVFTSSAYRYYDTMVELKKTNVGQIRSVISYGPSHTEPHHPDFYWYGVHPAEALYTVMGTGCESVVRTTTPDTDVATGTWSGGRVGILCGIRTKPLPHKVTVFGDNGFAEQKSGGDSYAPLVAQIMEFFKTGVSPIPAEETIEMFAFMEAADESKRRGGQPVKLSEVLQKARKR
jgi:predicted dehydrogenase